jgi:hypothetical protein
MQDAIVKLVDLAHAFDGVQDVYVYKKQQKCL